MAPESVIRIETEPSLRPDALVHAPLRLIEPGPLASWGYDPGLWEYPSRLTLLVLSSQLFADQQDRIRFFHAVLSQGRVLIPEVPFRRADGTSAPVKAEGALVPEASGFLFRLSFTPIAIGETELPPAGDEDGEEEVASPESSERETSDPVATRSDDETPRSGEPRAPIHEPEDERDAPAFDVPAQPRDLRTRVLEYLGIPDVGRTAERVVRFLDWSVPRRAPLLIVGAEGTGTVFLVEAVHGARTSGSKLDVIDAELAGSRAIDETIRSFMAVGSAASSSLLVRRADAAGDAVKAVLLDTARKLAEDGSRPLRLYLTARPGSDLIRLFADEVGGDVFTIPSLSERSQDVLPAMSRILKRPRPGARLFQSIHPDAARLLQSYDWPGNMNEMREIVEAARMISGGSELRVEDLPSEFLRKIETTGSYLGPPVRRKLPSSVQGRRGRPEKKLSAEEIRDALAEADGRRAEAARILGVSRTTLWRKMSELAEPVEPEGSGETRRAGDDHRSGDDENR